MQDWPVRPLMHGTWKTLPLGDAADILARVAWYEFEEELRLSAPEVEYRRVRALPLSCFPGWFLAEAEALLPEGVLGYQPILFGADGGLRVPDGTAAAPLNAFSCAGMPALAEDQEDQYLELFIALARGSNGRFQVIRDLADLDLAEGFVLENPDAFADAVLPRCWRPEDGSGIWCTMTYGRGVFNARLCRDRDGQVRMEEDERIAGQPLRREAFRGPFRIPLADPWPEDGGDDATAAAEGTGPDAPGDA